MNAQTTNYTLDLNAGLTQAFGDGTNLGDKITFGCFTEASHLSFEVDDIVIKDLKVIDWGEVREVED